MTPALTQALIIFGTIFLAELGDKTQLATLLFATEKQTSAWLVFAVASLALIAATGVAVVLGAAAEAWLTRIPLKLIAGVGFVLIGLWTVWSHFHPA